MANIIDSDTVIQGALAASTLSLTTASIGNTMIVTPGSGGDYIAHTKVKHLVPLVAQVDGTLSTGEARLFSAYAAGSLVQLNLALDTVPTSTNTVIVDLQKSTAGGAYASVLSATYTFNNSSTARTTYTVTPNTTAFIAGDLFKVTWTVTGSSAADFTATLYAAIDPS